MSEVYLYPGAAPSVQVSLASSLHRIARVNDSCDAEVRDKMAYLATSSRLYCLSLEPPQVTWTCALPSGNFRRLWVCGETVWLADGTGTLVTISPPSPNIVSSQLPQSVLCVFLVEEKVHALLEGGEVRAKCEGEWVRPAPWLEGASEAVPPLRQVFTVASRLVLVADWEIQWLCDRQWVKYEPQAQIVHAAPCGDTRVRLLLQEKGGQVLQELTAVGSQWVAGRAERVAGVSLVKLLDSAYALEYSNAGICLARFSHNECVLQLKSLIAAGKFREAEPVLEALGHAALPLLRSFFERTCRVQEVTALLKLAKLLPLDTLAALCEDLIRNPPTDVDCAVNLFSGALKTLSEAGARPGLEALRQSFISLTHKAETFRLVSASVSERLPDFLASNLQEEARDLLTRGRLREALCLLRRHLADLQCDVVPLLHYLPEKFSLAALVQWLRDELVPMLSEEQLGQLETWVESRARGLADLDVKLAYELATIIPSSRRNPLIAGASGFAVVQQHRQLSDLTVLQTQLKALLSLRTTYDLALSFNEFLRVSPEDVADMLLQRIDSEARVLPQLRHFRQYVDAQGWKSDTILLNFFLKRPPLSDKVLLALAQEIRDEDSRTKAAECVLEQATLPLSADMKALASLCSHRASPSQVLFAEALEAAQRLHLPQLSLGDRRQMLHLLDVLAVKPDWVWLASKLAQFLGLGPESIFERQVLHHVRQGTATKIAVPGDLGEVPKRFVLKVAFRCALAMLRQSSRTSPHLRKLGPAQVEIYSRGIAAVEFLGQVLQNYIPEEEFVQLAKEPTKAAPFLRRLARDNQLFLSFEEWKNREVNADVLAAIAAVQGGNSMKRRRPEEKHSPDSHLLKRTKVQTLGALLASGCTIKARSAQGVALDLLQALAAQPSAVSVEDLTATLCSTLVTSAPSPALLSLLQYAGLVRHVAQSMGVLRMPLKLLLKDYFASSGRFLFCNEPLSTAEKDFVSLVQLVASAVRSGSPQDVVAWCRRHNTTVALLPFLRTLPKVEAQEVVETLLWDVLRATHVDVGLAVSLLLCLPKARSFDLLSKASSNPNNSLQFNKSIAGTAVAFASLTRAGELRGQWVLREANITWQHRLTTFGIPFNPAIFSLRPDATRLVDLIPALLFKSQNYELVLEFCRSYSLPEIEAVGAFVEQQLLAPKVRAEFLAHLDDPPESLAEMLKTSPFEKDYEGLVRAVLCSQPKESVKQIVMKVLSRVPQVDYERVLFIFSLLLDTGLCPQMARQKQIVELLLDYRRVVSPSPAEKCAMRESQHYYPPELANLCEALHLVRIPLDFVLTNGKETLAREANVRTVEQLIVVGSMIRCDADFLRITAVKNDLLAHQHAKSDACPGCPPLSSLKGAIAKLRSFPDKYELAVSVTRHFSVSEEFVGAANFCRITAGLWLETLPSGSDEHTKVQGFVRESEKRAREAALQFELQQYGLLASFGHLTHTPEDLVAQLIFDLAPRLDSDSPVCEDELWSIVTALAKRSDLRLDETMDRLVQWWVAVPKSEECCAYALSRAQGGSEAEARLLFLSRHWDLLAVVSTLLKLVDAETGVTLRQKTEALGLLLRICPKEELEQILSREKLRGASVLQYYQHCFYLVDLEEMRIPYRMDTLLDCDKAAFVRAFLVSNSSDPRAVQLAVSLVCDFSVSEPDVLTSLIALLAAQEDFDRLCALLHTLALKGVLVRLSESVLDALVLCVNHYKSVTFDSQQTEFGRQVSAFAAILERLDPPGDKLAAFIRLLLDGFFPRELMESLIPACVRMILLVPDPATLQALSQAFAERFARSYPLLVVSAVATYVDDSQHSLLREVFFKVEEEGSYQPLLQAPELMTQLCTFLVKNDHCKRLLKLAKHKLGRSALADISNASSQEAAIRKVVARLQQSSL